MFFFLFLSHFNTAFNEAMPTSICLSVGSLVVIRCSHNPGAMTVLTKKLFPNLLLNLISSYPTPEITGSNNILPPNLTHSDPDKKLKVAMERIRIKNKKDVPQRG